MQFKGEFETFYSECLTELKGRNDYSDAFIPILERYVLITMKCQELGGKIVDAEVTVEHTNKASHTNKATSPDWRMFVLLNKEANDLARQLKLSPISAPTNASKKKENKGFDLSNKMKVA